MKRIGKYRLWYWIGDNKGACYGYFFGEGRDDVRCRNIAKSKALKVAKERKGAGITGNNLLIKRCHALDDSKLQKDFIVGKEEPPAILFEKNLIETSFFDDDCQFLSKPEED